MMATCSVDKTVTIWDTYNDSENPATGPPKACGNKDMAVGKLYTVNFYPSTPWLMGCAGSGKELALWDMARETAIQKRFASRIGNEPVTDEPDANDTNQKEAFDAMMANKIPELPSNNKKKGGSTKKKKAHKVKR